MSAAKSDPGTTLRRKLLAWVLPPLLAVFVLDAAGSYFLAARVASRIYDAELAELARELLLHVRTPSPAAFEFDLPLQAERILLLDESDRVSYAVSTGAGRRLAGDPQLAAAAAGHAGISYDDARLGATPVRVAQLVARPPNAAPGQIAVIRVAETLNKRHRLVELILAGIIVPQLVLILAATLLVAFGVERALLPLARLRDAIAARSYRDLSPLVPGGVPGEVRPLVESVNDLMRRLEGVLDAQNRFVADAAHQLRTPVAGLKAHVEVALREHDLEQTRRALAHLYTGVERLARLVAQLLALARNEPGALPAIALVPLDLNRLTRETTMEWVPAAYRRSIDLGFEGPPGAVTIDADGVRLAELLNNLLDNAVRYSRPGGRVTVRVAPGARPAVSVSDDGPRIPPAERERVFERFHRLLETHAGGSGLGLAIVREIASLHGAEITLEDDVDGVGNTFSVTFPAPAPVARAVTESAA